MAKKKKREETLQQLEARVAGKVMGRLMQVQQVVQSGNEIVKKGVLEALDELLGEDDEG